jgi:hypothetical protein
LAAIKRDAGKLVPQKKPALFRIKPGFLAEF